jgi:hypothetical protein
LVSGDGKAAVFNLIIKGGDNEGAVSRRCSITVANLASRDCVDPAIGESLKQR